VDGQVDDVVHGNIFQELSNEVHGQLGSGFVEAVDFLDGISQVALFPESSKDLVKTVLGVSVAGDKSQNSEDNNKSLDHLLTKISKFVLYSQGYS